MSAPGPVTTAPPGVTFTRRGVHDGEQQLEATITFSTSFLYLRGDPKTMDQREARMLEDLRAKAATFAGRVA